MAYGGTLFNDRAFSEVNDHEWQSIGGVREISHVGNGDRYAGEMGTNLASENKRGPGVADGIGPMELDYVDY